MTPKSKRHRDGIASGDKDCHWHHALARTGSFNHLGCVIDEEQHFGVGQKERLKELRGGHSCADVIGDTIAPRNGLVWGP